MTDEDQRLGPPPIEPMSDVAWARVERGLWSRMDTGATAAVTVRSRRWLWIAAPALAAAAGLAIVIGTTGDKPQPGRNDDSVRLVSREAPSSASIGDAHVTLDPESAVVMPRAATGPSAIVERGAATFSISPRTGRSFTVAAGDTTVRVVGTKFRVARSEELATVEVEHGVVEVTFRGITREVKAGESWRSTDPADVIAAQTAEVTIADVPRPAEPRPVTRRAPKHEAPTQPAQTEQGDAANPDEPAQPAPSVTPSHRAVKPGAAPAETEQQKYERFVALEVRDPKAAIDGYLSIARGTGTYAELALYAAARLAADRGEKRAVTLLKMYVTRFPNGRNIDDAVLYLDRIQGDR